MKRILTITVALLAAGLTAASDAGARSYQLTACPVKFGNNYYSVTKFQNCAFGRAASRSMLAFALTSRKRGSVVFRYQHKRYRLGCISGYNGLGVQCGVPGRPCVVMFLDSATAPPGYNQWPTHTF